MNRDDDTNARDSSSSVTNDQGDSVNMDDIQQDDRESLGLENQEDDLL